MTTQLKIKLKPTNKKEGFSFSLLTKKKEKGFRSFAAHLFFFLFNFKQKKKIQINVKKTSLSGKIVEKTLFKP